MLLQSAMSNASRNPFRFIGKLSEVYRLIDEKLRINLASGTPIDFNPQAEHFCYSVEEALLFLNYILDSDELLPIYATEAFRQNIRYYLETFIIPGLWRRQQQTRFEFVTPASEREAADLPPCILMHGRFNGVPHSGYISSLLYAKRLYPGLPVTLAVETDEYSMVAEGQYPFASVMMRASLLWLTGLIDRLAIIQSPTSGADERADYWNLTYGIDTGIFNPRVILAGGEEDAERKWQGAPLRRDIHILDTREIGANVHMTDLREGLLTAGEVVAHWQPVQSALRMLGEI
ncbi:hypothetical protein KC640_01135 [Candidatus Dojkabacteria bacterium]|uniref:Uncharacterized protein n=1 Tax=Candidatus Dojkabacteria bacterium TaxID=2099670 RepID=A0A955KZE6_9BACT|nr:hypothetical protein [Candidatus Dojkabacteria bacterium]